MLEARGEREPCREREREDVVREVGVPGEQGNPREKYHRKE